MKRLVRDGDCLVLVEAGREIAVCVPSADTWDMLDLLAPGETVTIGEPVPSTHDCLNREVLSARLQLALLADDNFDAYNVVVGQIGDCRWCLRNVMHWSVGQAVNAKVLQAGGHEAAAGALVTELTRSLMP
jgi:hypothetical protein